MDKLKLPKDFMQRAKFIADIATGEFVGEKPLTGIDAPLTKENIIPSPWADRIREIYDSMGDKTTHAEITAKVLDIIREYDETIYGGIHPKV